MRMMILVIRMMMMMMQCHLSLVMTLMMTLMRRVKKHRRRLNWERRGPLMLHTILPYLLKRQNQLLLKRQMVRRVVIRQPRILPRRLERLLQIATKLSRRPQNLLVNSLASLVARVSPQMLVFSHTQRPSMVKNK